MTILFVVRGGSMKIRLGNPELESEKGNYCWLMSFVNELVLSQAARLAAGLGGGWNPGD